MRRYSRRTVLASALAVAATPAIGCMPEVPAVARQPTVQAQTATQFQVMDPGYQDLSLPQVSSVLEHLTGKDGSTLEERLHAVVNNLCCIAVVGRGRVSALMVDESGIYLTAGHVFDERTEPTPAFEPTDAPAVVYHLATGEVTPVSSYLVDGEHDIAIFNAVRAAEPRAIPGIVADIATPKPGHPASMHAVMDSGSSSDTPRFTRTVLRGLIRRGDAPPEDTNGYADRMMVFGIIPFGGAGGAPVLDKDGYVIGIESGFYPRGARTHSQYQGATVTRMRAIVPLVQNGTVVRLQPVN